MTNLENTNPHQGNSEYIQIWKWKKKERYLCSINRIKNVTVFPSSMLVLIVSNVAKTKTKQSFPITTVTTRPLHLGMWASDRVCVCVCVEATCTGVLVCKGMCVTHQNAHFKGKTAPGLAELLLVIRS